MVLGQCGIPPLPATARRPLRVRSGVWFLAGLLLLNLLCLFDNVKVWASRSTTTRVGIMPILASRMPRVNAPLSTAEYSHGATRGAPAVPWASSLLSMRRHARTSRSGGRPAASRIFRKRSMLAAAVAAPVLLGLLFALRRRTHLRPPPKSALGSAVPAAQIEEQQTGAIVDANAPGDKNEEANLVAFDTDDIETVHPAKAMAVLFTPVMAAALLIFLLEVSARLSKVHHAVEEPGIPKESFKPGEMCPRDSGPNATVHGAASSFEQSLPETVDLPVQSAAPSPVPAIQQGEAMPSSAEAFAQQVVPHEEGTAPPDFLQQDEAKSSLPQELPEVKSPLGEQRSFAKKVPKYFQPKPGRHHTPPSFPPLELVIPGEE